MVLRQLPFKFYSFEQIGLPEGIKPLLRKPRGLILVTGPTGSGKTVAYLWPALVHAAGRGRARSTARSSRSRGGDRDGKIKRRS